jgi:hypothetical protein
VARELAGFVWAIGVKATRTPNALDQEYGERTTAREAVGNRDLSGAMAIGPIMRLPSGPIAPGLRPRAGADHHLQVGPLQGRCERSRPIGDCPGAKPRGR